MGKVFIFFAFVWVITGMLGGIMMGVTQGASTHLTAAITDTDDTINVVSTEGFGDKGIIVIGDERIAHSKTTATTFGETLGQQMVRGADGTTAVAHSAGAVVRTVEGGMVNDVITYNIALIADTSGAWAAIVWPLALLRIIMSLITAPFGFLGTDLAIITVFWAVGAAGMIISLIISLAGGRRV